MRTLFFLFFSTTCIGGELIIEGEKIEYKGDLISASTKTRISFENINMEGEEIEIKKETILCTKAHLKTERFQFFGERIRREKQRLEIENGWFSTCSNEKPHFRLTSKRITIGPKLVKAFNIKLLLGNFPIFYIPFYSFPLKLPDSPYEIGFGRSDYLGFFVKTRYNYYFEEKKGSFLLDYYQKRDLGCGFNILSNNGALFGYYNDDKSLLDLLYKKGPITIAIERLSDNAFSYNYLNGDIKEKTKSYIMLEKTGVSEIYRLGIEEDDNFSNRVYYIPKANIFLSGRKFWSFQTSLDISGEYVYKDGFNLTLNPKISKRVFFLPILQIFDIKVKNNGDSNISSISHIRVINNKNMNLDIGYSIFYPLKDKEEEKKVFFLYEGGFFPYFGSIEGEFFKKKLDNIIFLFSTPYGRIEGRYKNKKVNASLSMEFKKERYELGLFWSIKGDEKQTIVPSILLKRPNSSIKISGGEDKLEISTSKAYHCINVDFMINTKQDIGINVRLR